MSFLANLTRTEWIDSLNIGLIVLSFILALLIPLPLFLFAYAVLGPLHYLTEISWLHDRRYFLRETWATKPFIIVSILVSVGILMGQFPPAFTAAALYSLFGGALILAVVEKKSHREALIVLLLVSAVAFSVFQPPLYVLFFTLFIPTVIHVFFFTGAFMLSGALKSGSRPGFASCGILLLAAIGLFFIVPDRGTLLSNQYLLDSYQPFSAVNTALISLLSSGGSSVYPNVEELFTSHLGQAVMQFLAFAYTYHYLNWFSKSRVIGWNRVSPSRRALIIGGWVGAVFVYMYDYRVGVEILFLLSFLHVLLEFPLNHRSFADIGQRVASAFSRKPIVGV